MAKFATCGSPGKARDVIDVNLRNQYPPFVADMRGAMRGLAIYAWEESGFPERYVAEFNSTLNLITVPSRFVAKVLRDNGVYAPIRVVGEGCDHVLDDGRLIGSLSQKRGRFVFCTFHHVFRARPWTSYWRRG